MPRDPTLENVMPSDASLEPTLKWKKLKIKGLYSTRLLKTEDYEEQKELLDLINAAPDKAEIVNLLSYLEKMERQRAQLNVVPKMHSDLIVYTKIIISGLDLRQAKRFKIGVMEKLTLFLERDIGQKYPIETPQHNLFSQNGENSEFTTNLENGDTNWIEKHKKILIILVAGGVSILLMSLLFTFQQGGLITLFIVVLVLFTQLFGKSGKKTR